MAIPILKIYFYVSIIKANIFSNDNKTGNHFCGNQNF